MTNADDSPPSGSDRQGGSSQANRDGDSPSDKRGSSSKATPSSLGINLPKNKKKGSSGFSIPRPGSVGGDDADEQDGESSSDAPSGDSSADGENSEAPREEQTAREEAGGSQRQTLMGVGPGQQEAVGLAEDTEQTVEEPAGDHTGGGGVYDATGDDGFGAGSRGESRNEAAEEAEEAEDPQAHPEEDPWAKARAEAEGSAETEQQAREEQQTREEPQSDDQTFELDEGDFVDEESVEPAQDQSVTVGGDPNEEFEDEPTMISDDFFEAQGADEQDGGSGGQDDDPHAHGEATLDGDDFDEGDFDDYEKTVVGGGLFEQGQDFQAANEAPQSDGADDAADGGPAPDISSDPSSGAHDNNQSFGQAPGASSNSAAGSSPQNPPTPEHSGPGGGQARRSPDPTAEAPQGYDQQPAHGQSAQQHNAQPEADDFDDSDFNDQKTEVFSSPFESDPITPKLSILEGPGAGQEFLLNKMRNTVGRATDNSVTLPDEAMSRKHFEVIKNTDDSYSIKDLQSVNGTYLNGTQIKRADLFHGDRIKTGRATLQFVVPGERPQQEERDRRLVPAATQTQDGQPRSAPRAAQPSGAGGNDDQLAVWINRVIFGAIILCIPLMGFFVYLTVFKAPAKNGATQQAQTAKQQYIQGVQAVKTRDWDTAETHFQKARKLNPNIEGVQAQLKRLKMEKEARADLERAREALEAEETDKALELAEAVPRESVYYEDARELVRREKRKERLGKLFTKAEDQFEDGESKDALATIQAILSTVPNHDKALELRRKILTETDAELSDEEKKEIAAKAQAREEARRKEQEKKQAQAQQDGSGGGRAGQTDQQAAGGRVRVDNSPSGSSGSDDSSGNSWLLDDAQAEDVDSEDDNSGGGGGARKVVNFTKGFTLYKQRQFGAAITHFRTAAKQSGGSVSQRAEMAAKNIQAFKSAYDSAESALNSGRWNEAASLLRKALRADKDVASSGFFRSEITGKLGRAEAEMGLAELNSKNYSSAYRHYKRAKQYQSSQAQVRDLRRQLLKKAQSLYIQAAAKKKSDAARAASLCRTIKDMVPPSSQPYQKADKLLKEM